MNTASTAFKQAKDKILQAPSTDEEKQTHTQIRSSLTPDQQKAVDALQKIARDKDKYFFFCYLIKIFSNVFISSYEY